MEEKIQIKINRFAWLWQFRCWRVLMAKLKRRRKEKEIRRARRGAVKVINPVPPKKVLAKREKVAKIRGYTGEDYRNYVRYGKTPKITISF